MNYKSSFGWLSPAPLPAPSFCRRGYELVASLPALMCQGHLPGTPVPAITPSSRPAHISSEIWPHSPLAGRNHSMLPQHILIAVCLSVRCNSLLIILSAFLGVSKYRLLIHTVSPAPRTLPGRGWGSVNTCAVPSETMTFSLSLNDRQVARELLAGRSKSQSPQLLPIDVYRIFFSSAKWETALKYVLYKTG